MLGARALVAEVERKIATDDVPQERGPLTVRKYGEQWIEGRKGRIRSWRAEQGRFEHHVYPKNRDKDSSWRDGAVFTRSELESLISDTRVPEDRRVFYALMGLAGLRSGEVAGLRWLDYESLVEPLGKITFRTTKNGHGRKVPVHPVLAGVEAVGVEC